MKPRGRWFGVLLTVFGIVLLAGAPALAAIPAFEWEIETRPDSIVITIDFESVPLGFAWRSLEGSGALGELVGVLPADAVDGEGRPTDTADLVLADLQRVETGIYAAGVAVTTGEWAVVALPLVPDFDPDRAEGTPRTELIGVGPEADAPATAWLLVVTGVGVFALGAAVWVSRRRYRTDP